MFRGVLFFPLVVLLLFTAHPAASAELSGETVRLCHGNGGWPPYHYRPANVGDPNLPMVGFSIDLVKKVFDVMGVSFTIEAVPWKRCLVGAKAFDGKGGYEAIIDGSFNEARTKDFFFSIPIYETRPVVYHRKDRPIEAGLDLSTKDLRGRKICSDRAFNIAHYGLTKADLEMTSNNLAHSFVLLERGRCDVVPHIYEVPMGFPLSGQALVTDALTHTPAENFPPYTFHIMVSKQSPRAAALVAEINQTILILKSNGFYGGLERRYGLR